MNLTVETWPFRVAAIETPAHVRLLARTSEVRDDDGVPVYAVAVLVAEYADDESELVHAFTVRSRDPLVILPEAVVPALASQALAGLAHYLLDRVSEELIPW